MSRACGMFSARPSVRRATGRAGGSRAGAAGLARTAVVLEARVGAVRHGDEPVALVVGAAVVGGEAPVLRAPALAAKGLVHEAALSVEDVDVVGAVAVAEVDVLGARRHGEPRRPVRRLGVLPKVAGALPHDAAVQSRLGELLRIVGVVQKLLGRAVGGRLGGNLQAVRRAGAERRVAAVHEDAVGAIGLPPNEAVLLLLCAALVGEVDVVRAVGDQPIC